tara:strand:- start:1713 stop:2036 length:324 start_codon:yes stop_codon:yes gene_type:complete
MEKCRVGAFRVTDAPLQHFWEILHKVHIKLRARTPPKRAQTRKEQRCARDNAETIEKVVQADAFFGESALISRQVRGEHKPSSASFASDRAFRLRVYARFTSHVYAA